MVTEVMEMEFRVLKYFLAVARTENISHAAEAMHVSQPALSRQLMDLEEELGVKLLVRGNRNTTLTEAGFLLKKRAEEIAQLVDKTVDELSHAQEGVSGSVRIGCGETAGMRVVARAIQDLRKEYPNIHYQFQSMDGMVVKEQLKRGTLDFGVLIQPEPPQDYPHIELAHEDIWGVLMRKDSPLAAHTTIRAADLEGLPLIASRQALTAKELGVWFDKDESELNIIATYTLIYNASLLAEEGVGYVLCLDRLVHLPKDGKLVFRPLEPQNSCRIFFIWKKNQLFSEAARLLKEKVMELSET